MTQTPPPSASANQPPFVPGGVPGGPAGGVPGAQPGPQRAQLSAAAVCALVAASVALVPVGVVLGIVALFRIQRLRLRGKRLAVVALSLCAAWTALGMAAIIATAAALAAHQGPINAFGAGTCFTYVNGSDVAEGIDVVDCTAQHDGEILARHGLGGSFPGPDASARESVVGCLGDAARAMPDAERVDPAVARVRVYYPDQQQWDAGMHKAVCVLTGIENQTLQVDALDGSGLTSMQRQVLQLTNESVLLRGKLHDIPAHGWKLAAALEQRLAVVDRAESTALDRLATNPAAGSPGVPEALRSLATADTTEAAHADTEAGRITDDTSWQTLIGAGTTTSSATDSAYSSLRHDLQLPQPLS